MRRPVLFKRGEKQRTEISKPFPVPAPVGGLNALDSIADMDIRYASIMQNWWPTTKDIMVRKGYANHVTGLTAQVESLMPYISPAGTELLFAAEGTDFFDVTNAGAVGSAVVSSLNN